MLRITLFLRGQYKTKCTFSAQMPSTRYISASTNGSCTMRMKATTRELNNTELVLHGCFPSGAGVCKCWCWFCSLSLYRNRLSLTESKVSMSKIRKICVVLLKKCSFEPLCVWKAYRGRNAVERFSLGRGAPLTHPLPPPPLRHLLAW